MRCWVKNHPVKAQSPDHPGSVILSKEPSHQADFSRHVGSLSKAQVKKVARFLPNPEKHWGPKSHTIFKPLNPNRDSLGCIQSNKKQSLTRDTGRVRLHVARPATDRRSQVVVRFAVA
ncbi:hypothetical protein F2Q68_00022696 [Brassica cretica]|uniref:Uncharacterized protein n=1 Tax=Brassica cretica TaxID=69181 RepID=A0A8S9FX61_BRACR|nr:hypothetical protein F2Q68_00022696 [Brassica cretica]